MSGSRPAHVPVLIAGGGPVGLAAAVELGRRGVGCLVVEPRRQVSTARPRCKTLNVRTMEHLRRWGLADRLRERAPLPVSWSQDVVFCTSLSGWELSRFTGVLGLSTQGDRFAETGQQAPQYVLEEVLRAHVAELEPCELLLGARVAAVHQDEERATAAIENEAGERFEVTADYVLGCDGPRSVVREQIGSAYVGGQALRPNFGMVFRSRELWKHVGHGPAVQYWVVNADAPALVGPLDRTDTWWAIAFGVGAEAGRNSAHRIIDALAGTAVEAEVLSTDPWTARMQIVDRMRDRRVFLAGDAAHLNPPFGGHGLNTGIGDAVDLGWKIAAVLAGWGGEQLLNSYEAERRPIQERVIAEASANMRVLSTELLADNLDDADAAGARAREAAGRRIQETKTAEFHSLELVLEQRIDSSPVIPGDLGTAAVGRRLAHRQLSDGRSLFDVLGPDLSLLAGPDARAQADAFEQAAETCGVPVTRLDLAASSTAPLVLVRPDQVVAWQGAGVPDARKLIDQVRGGV
ncbi:FAD-dependent oxidoreductase [Catenulispora yoronensis]|uniref:FAD-dependent oxidoreductase n=2 Tax=Catenulispora yoronensis TaxID=450799 RepID=A0ABP5G246_9ACTN